MPKSKEKQPEEILHKVLARLEQLGEKIRELGMSQEELLWTHTLRASRKDLEVRIQYLEE